MPGAGAVPGAVWVAGGVPGAGGVAPGLAGSPLGAERGGVTSRTPGGTGGAFGVVAAGGVPFAGGV
ncbi:hypothetical protein [Afipia sp. Root123D2]|uniref:hypothetical protein n=1 Tax=Afipia sp. Root123D2 TaxID=1736436 RepID=UPI0032DE2FA3